MTIRDLKESLPRLMDEEREPCRELCKLFSPVSVATLVDFQVRWDADSKTYEEFVEAQNKIILLCIEMEVSEFGTLARKAMNLPPLTLETEIPEKNSPAGVNQRG